MKGRQLYDANYMELADFNLRGKNNALGVFLIRGVAGQLDLKNSYRIRRASKGFKLVTGRYP